MELFLIAAVILLALSALVGYFYFEKWFKKLKEEKAAEEAMYNKRKAEFESARKAEKEERDKRVAELERTTSFKREWNSLDTEITQQVPKMVRVRRRSSDDLTAGQKKILEEAEKLLAQQEKMLNEMPSLSGQQLDVPALSGWPGEFRKRKITIKRFSY
jgi:hypothetical protein